MKKKRSPLGKLLMVLVFIFLYAPIIVLIIFSFNASRSRTTWTGFTFAWYPQLFHDTSILNSLYTTLAVSILSAAIATVAGTFAAIGFSTMRKRWRSPLLAVNNIPVMNADIVTGVSMCLLFVSLGTILKFKLGFLTLLIAHVTFNIPYVILSVMPKIQQMDSNLVDAAQDLGCTWTQAFFKVMVPEIMPGIVNGMIIAFTMSIDDFVISYFTAGSKVQTLSMKIYAMTRKKVSPKINAISTLLFFSVLILLLIINFRQTSQDKPKKIRVRKNTRGTRVKRVVAVVIVAALVVVSVPLAVLGSAGGAEEEVNVYNWGEYIDESIFKQFEEETGIRVNYSTFSSNETLYSTLKTGAGTYDVIFPSDYMLSRFIEEDMIEKLDFSNIPNYELIDDQFKYLADPTGEYSVPYMWGTVGIIYNSDMVDDEVTSWDIMFNEKYKDQILMFDNSRDAIGIALKYLGYDLNTTDEAELNEAYEILEQEKPLLQAYVMDQIFDKLESGEAAIGPYYAGDYLTMLENNEALRFVIPKEGSNLFYDAMCIPKDADNKKNAELFINFMCRSDICIANMDITGYTSANKEAWDEYSEDLTEEEYNVMFPDEDTLSRCEVYINLPQNILDLYDKLWVDLKSKS